MTPNPSREITITVQPEHVPFLMQGVAHNSGWKLIQSSPNIGVYKFQASSFTFYKMFAAIICTEISPGKVSVRCEVTSGIGALKNQQEVRSAVKILEEFFVHISSMQSTYRP